MKASAPYVKIFFALAMTQHGIPFSYVKSVRGEKIPDFLIPHKGEKIVLEIGGKGKGRSQFKGIEYDKKIILYHTETSLESTPERIPLHILGFAE